MQQINRFISTAILFLGIIATTIYPAMADKQYDNFIKNQLAQFQSEAAPKNCKEKKRKVDSRTTYELCEKNDKPTYLRHTYFDKFYNVTLYSYRNGQLVQVCNYSCFGYKNNRLVVEWLDTDKTVNFNVSSSEFKTKEKNDLAESREGLRLFGINPK
ncbi:MAG: hypothetical protein KME64_14255 [Scytonematopsis contorta HA4267-MV1]|jgi:hypothetical protein|nr:hypothetical protein [Scytonematopsis contorta HA4267-MV1]